MTVAKLLMLLWIVVQNGAQQPVDTSKIGPPVGSVAPPFRGPDQRGIERSLASAAGPKGTMLVFFRSADW